MNTESDPASAAVKSWLDTPRNAGLTMLAGVFCWAVGVIIFKEVLLYFDPFIAAFGRMFFGLCAFVAVFNVNLLKIARSVTWKHWRVYLFAAFCEPCFYLLFLSYGMKYTTVSQTAVITACLPIVVTLVAWVTIKEKPGRYALPGFIIAVAAIALLNTTTTSSAYAPHPVLGNCLLIAAILCSSGYYIALRRFAMPYPLMFSAVVQAFMGSVFIIPVIIISGTPLPASWPLLPTTLLVLSGVVTTFGVYTLVNICIPKMPLSRLTAFVNMVPVFTIALSILIMGERLTLLQAVCCAAILLSVIVSQRVKPILPAKKPENLPPSGGE